MKLNKTKIIATLGPASDSKILELIECGVNLFRINFSHAEYERTEKTISKIRSISDEHHIPVGILADLQGPKIRVGKVSEGSYLNEGASFVLTNQEVIGDAQQAYISYTRIAQDAQVGERILIDDGKIVVEVVSTDERKGIVYTSVIQGGELKSNKGVNLPNTATSIPALTEKDIRDVRFAMQQKVDWFALSFVRSAQDIQQLAKIIEQESPVHIPIVAKIEKPEAVDNLDDIISTADAIMVARGDLGIEMPIHEVPVIQKNIVKKSRRLGKPVIIATQMLESMIHSMMPTRAEANDVANAVMDGADAVMLSGETAVGKHPEEVVKTMSDIIASVERSRGLRPARRVIFDPRSSRFVTDTVCQNATQVAVEIHADAILTLTNSGYTGYKIASYRPGMNILVFTSNRRLLNQMSLVWGVVTFFYNSFESTDQTINDINAMAKERLNLQTDAYVINLSSMPIHERGKVNTLRITQIK